MVAVARRRAGPPAPSGTSPGRPVLLATLDVPFDRDAVAFAVAAAAGSGQRLVVVNVVERPPLPMSAMLGYDDLPYPPEMERSLGEPVRLARALGIGVTRLRVKSFHPIPALLEVVAEQDAGLLVFGPDRSRIPRLRYRRAARAISATVTALVWLAPR